MNLCSSTAASNNKQRPQILFFGSDLFAAIHLRSLIRSQVGHIEHVVTAKSAKAEIISVASEYGLNIHRADTNFTMDNWYLPDGQFDLGVVVSFGYKIPSRIISQIPLGMINVHPSLLPSYRGASPIQSVILNRESETGLCIIDIAPDLIDSGRILSCQKIGIEHDETFVSLRDRLAQFGSQMLINTIANIDIARANAVYQSSRTDGIIRVARKIQKQDALVDCTTMTADDIFRVYRALYGYMTIFCNWRGKKLLLLELERGDGAKMKIAAGDLIYDPQSDRLLIGCYSDTYLYASRIQIATRKSLSPVQFAHGYHLPIRPR